MVYSFCYSGGSMVNLTVELLQRLLQRWNDTNTPPLLKKLHGQALEPPLTNPMQSVNAPVRLGKPNHATRSCLLREKLQANLQLLDAVKLESETAHTHEINWVTL
jgi:hypothetical protein